MDTLSDDDVEFDSKPMEKDMQDKKKLKSNLSSDNSMTEIDKTLGIYK